MVGSRIGERARMVCRRSSVLLGARVEMMQTQISLADEKGAEGQGGGVRGGKAKKKAVVVEPAQRDRGG